MTKKQTPQSNGVEKVSREVKAEQDRLVTALTALRPTAMVEILDTVQTLTPQKTETETWNDTRMRVVTYKSNTADTAKDPTLKIAYPEDLENSKAFRTVTDLYGFANDVGAKSRREEGIKLNDFMSWLQYKKKKGAYRQSDKRSVWEALYTASRTQIRRSFTYKIKTKGRQGTEEKTIMFEQPPIQIAGVYDHGGVELKDYTEKPPDSVLIKFDDFLITQLQGKDLKDGQRVVKDAVPTPKLAAADRQRRYQGYAEGLLLYLCKELKISQPKSGVRNYPKEELIKRASKIAQGDKAINKLVERLNLFKEDGHIKDWGFRKTLKGKQLGKTYKKCPVVWVDWNDTPTLERIKKFKRKPAQEKRIERLEKEVKEFKGRTKDLERKNKEYGI